MAAAWSNSQRIYSIANSTPVIAPIAAANQQGAAPAHQHVQQTSWPAHVAVPLHPSQPVAFAHPHVAAQGQPPVHAHYHQTPAPHTHTYAHTHAHTHAKSQMPAVAPAAAPQQPHHIHDHADGHSHGAHSHSHHSHHTHGAHGHTHHTSHSPSPAAAGTAHAHGHTHPHPHAHGQLPNGAAGLPVGHGQQRLTYRDDDDDEDEKLDDSYPYEESEEESDEEAADDFELEDDEDQEEEEEENEEEETEDIAEQEQSTDTDYLPTLPPTGSGGGTPHAVEDSSAAQTSAPSPVGPGDSKQTVSAQLDASDPDRALVVTKPKRRASAKALTVAKTGDEAGKKKKKRDKSTSRVRLSDEFVSAALNGDLDRVADLRAQVTLNCKNRKWGFTALMAAAGNGHLHVVRYLVTCGSNINAQDKGGWTALMLAARGGRAHVVEYLVRCGADVKKRTKYNQTVYALYGGSKQVVFALERGLKARLAAAGAKTRRAKSVINWNEDDVESWLKVIGLDQYAVHFKEQHINGDVLLDLSSRHFEHLRVVDPAHQERLLHEIDILRMGSDDGPPTPA